MNQQQFLEKNPVGSVIELTVTKADLEAARAVTVRDSTFDVSFTKTCVLAQAVGRVTGGPVDCGYNNATLGNGATLDSADEESAAKLGALVLSFDRWRRREGGRPGARLPLTVKMAVTRGGNR